MLVVWVNANEEEPGTWKEGKIFDLEMEFSFLDQERYFYSTQLQRMCEAEMGNRFWVVMVWLLC